MRATCWQYRPEVSEKVKSERSNRSDAHTCCVLLFYFFLFSLHLSNVCLFSFYFFNHLSTAQFGTQYYELVWTGRVGFAKVAKQARVPIIPIFTQNIREAFRTVQFGKGFFRWIYDRFRLPLMAIYGGFPVKLTTFVGKPILVDGTETPEEISFKVCCTFGFLFAL